jgi:hypothetical protein
MASQSKEIQRLQLDMEQISRTKSIFNSNQVQKIFNSTASRFKYQRPAKGGGQWTYVKTSYVRKVLDGIFGFDWDFEIETSAAEAFEIAKATKVCVVKGKLTGRVVVDGQIRSITKSQFGRAEVKFKTETIGGVKKPTAEPLDFGNDMKAATSDCLKKCASQLGIAADVYEAEEFQEIEVIGSQEHSERKKQLDKRIEESKKLIDEMGEEVR